MEDTDLLSCEVIHVFKTERVDAYNRIDIRIVKWSKSESRVLEKRRIWERKDGSEMTKKLMGLTRDDLAFVLSKIVEIEKLLGGSNEAG